MLKKMRRRFIIAAMAAITAVMFVLLLVINIWNYTINTDRLDFTLSKIYENDGFSPPPHIADDTSRGSNFFERPQPERKFMTRFFSVYLNADGEMSTFTDFIGSVSENEAVMYAEQILKKGRQSGYYNDYRYTVRPDNDGTIIIFLNASNELQAMRTLLIVSCTVAACTIFAIFILVAMLSGRAIYPINFETIVLFKLRQTADNFFVFYFCLFCNFMHIGIIKAEYGF